MTANRQSSSEQLRASILEVVWACPVEGCNPSDCPLFGVRQLNPNERLRWISDLSEADLRYLASYHEICKGIKLRDRSANAAGDDFKP